MKTHKNIVRLLHILVLICYLNSNAQQNDKVIPPTPEAASLGEYGSMPTGSYTGAAQHSIPLYVVRGRYLEIPVTLNYNSNGIKVEDKAPWTGYGWTLSAGGLINRTVLDLKDESRNFDAIPNIQNNQLNQENCKKIENELYDMQYDEFSFNFMGNSGTFIIVDRIARIIEAVDDYKIELIGNGTGAAYVLDEFLITDKNGIKYYFGKSYSGDSDPQETAVINDRPTPITSWHLTKITHWSGEIIKFEYTKEEQEVYFKDFGETATRNAAAELNCFDCPWPHPAEVPIYQNYYTKYRPKVFHLARISTITPNNDYIEINRSSGEINGKDLKIKLITSGNSDNLRKFLTEVQFKSVINTAFKKYTFNYYKMNDFNAISRNTKSKDWWGYYNGKDNSANSKGYIRGDHNPDPQFGKYGMLERITYPTGGITLFEYEGHSKEESSPPQCLNYAEYQINTTQGENSVDNYGGICDPVDFILPFATQVTFTLTGFYAPDPNPAINGSRKGFAHFSVIGPSGTISEINGYSISGNTEKIITVTLPAGSYSLNMSVRSSLYFARFKARFCDFVSSTPAKTYFGGVRVKKIIANPSLGHEFEQITRYDYNNSGDFKAPEQNTIIYNTVLCGGGGGGYQYYTHCDKSVKNSLGFLNSTGTSEGAVFYFNVSEIRYDAGEKVYEISNFYNDSPIKNRASPFIYNANITNYNPIRYYGAANKIKTEYFKFIGNNKQLVKREEFNYESKHNLNGEYHYSYIRETKIGAGEVVGFVPPANGELYYDLSKLFQLGEQFNLSKYTIPCFWTQLKNKKVENFFYDSSNNITAVTENTEYNYSEEVQPLNVLYPIHHQVTKEIIYNSSKLRKVISYKYPDDLKSSPYGGALESYQQQALNLLQRGIQHRIGSPVQTEVTVEEGQLIGNTNEFLINLTHRISTNRTTYKAWDQGIILPEYVKVSKGDITSQNILDDEIIFTKYALSTGKVLESKNKEGIYTSYIYDFFKKNVIAIIENASYADIASAMGQSETQLENIAQNGSGTIAVLESLRITLPNSMITTYTYSNDKILSVTDPKSFRTFFTYNIFNQLIYIKDSDGNVIKEFQYNFKS